MKAPLARTRKDNRLLARYCDTFGEMQLRKYTERAIRAGRAEAELNSRSKSAFLSTMSHELRTPLNAIIGFSDLIRAPGAATPEQAADYAGHIANAGRRLLDVVSDVLDMSRLESGSLALERRPLLVGEVLEVAVENARPLFVAKQQPLDLRIAPGLCEINGDAGRLRQLFTNLLSNASKFTAEKGRVLVMAKGARDGAVTIAIADTGIGMTHEQIVMAMKPFAQVQAHLARSQEGAGLGLPLAMGIVKLHGGSLLLDSQPGAGTTAIVTLPRGQAASGHVPESFRIGNVA
ncbi:MAG TPA: HAMP domain-containing sensor histidine kinase [Rhizomicrobium sp.]|nr:HAMP domain-containing sensor histidine kinase [Rhizomicrobium sp.]